MYVQQYTIIRYIEGNGNSIALIRQIGSGQQQGWFWWRVSMGREREYHAILYLFLSK
jgi:hypothetical protein